MTTICYCALAGTKACENCINNTSKSSVNIGVNNIPITFPDKYWPFYEMYEPIEDNKPKVTYQCPHCEAMIDMGDNFCRNCGKSINWDNFKD